MTWLVAPVILAGLVVIALGAGSPENRNPVPDGSDAVPRVPAACVVTAGRAYRFPTAVPTVAWGRLIGRVLLVVLAGVFVFFLAGIVLMAVFGPC